MNQKHQWQNQPPIFYDKLSIVLLVSRRRRELIMELTFDMWFIAQPKIPESIKSEPNNRLTEESIIKMATNTLIGS